MTPNLAFRPNEQDDAELAAIAEHIERRAWIDLIAAAPDWLRRTTGLMTDDVGGAMLLAAPGIDHLLFNRVIGLGERAPASEAQIADLMGRYWDLSIERYWLHVGPYARPARLGQLLRQQGLTQYRRSWVKMVRPAQRAASVHTNLRIREARADDATAIASVIGMGLNLPQCAAELLGLVIGRRGWRVFVAESSEQIVAAAGMFCEADVAYMAFAATRPEFRRRGAQRALLQGRINAAADADRRWIAAETGFPLTADEPNPSYRNLLWAGFRPVAIRDNYSLPGTLWDHGANG
ncbi:MAG: GNAT family N-acetyltransferase [Steroidobacter sp.]